MFDVFGARGHEVIKFAHSQGRRWEVKEVMGNVIAINVSLLNENAGTAIICGDPLQSLALFHNQLSSSSAKLLR